MSVPQSLGAPAVAQHHDEHRWPARLGLIGMAVGAVMAFNALQNLAHQLTWSEERWRTLFASVGADFVYEAMPTPAVMIGSALIEIALGALLLVGAWRLFWRERRAVEVCKAWAWATIAYVLIVAAWIFVWTIRVLPSITGVSGGTRSAALLGAFATLAVLGAFPLITLYWLGRPDIRRDYESW